MLRAAAVHFSEILKLSKIDKIREFVNTIVRGTHAEG